MTALGRYGENLCTCLRTPSHRLIQSDPSVETMRSERRRRVQRTGQVIGDNRYWKVFCLHACLGGRHNPAGIADRRVHVVVARDTLPGNVEGRAMIDRHPQIGNPSVTFTVVSNAMSLAGICPWS